MQEANKLIDRSRNYSLGSYHKLWAGGKTLLAWSRIRKPKWRGSRTKWGRDGYVKPLVGISRSIRGQTSCKETEMEPSTWERWCSFVKRRNFSTPFASWTRETDKPKHTGWESWTKWMPSWRWEHSKDGMKMAILRSSSSSTSCNLKLLV